MYLLIPVWGLAPIKLGSSCRIYLPNPITDDIDAIWTLLQDKQLTFTFISLRIKLIAIHRDTWYYFHLPYNAVLYIKMAVNAVTFSQIIHGQALGKLYCVIKSFNAFMWNTRRFFDFHPPVWVIEINLHRKHNSRVDNGFLVICPSQSSKLMSGSGLTNMV